MHFKASLTRHCDDDGAYSITVVGLTQFHSSDAWSLKTFRKFLIFILIQSDLKASILFDLSLDLFCCLVGCFIISSHKNISVFFKNLTGKFKFLSLFKQNKPIKSVKYCMLSEIKDNNISLKMILSTFSHLLSGSYKSYIMIQTIRAFFNKKVSIAHHQSAC